MKPNTIILIILVAAVILALVVSVILPSSSKEEIILVPLESITIVDGGSFALGAYGEYLVDFSSNQTTQPPENGTDAVHAAVSIWRDVYYYSKLESPHSYPHDVLDGLSSIIYMHDAQNDCWLIYGQLPSTTPPIAGGVPYMILKSDGTVLAVWHTQ